MNNHDGQGRDTQSGGLQSMYDGPRPAGYSSMKPGARRVTTSSSSTAPLGSLCLSLFFSLAI